MSGVSAIASPALPPELMEVLASNETIQARLKQFATAKAEADAARRTADKSLAALKLGEDVAAALEAAEKARDEARQSADAAIVALGEARASAQKTVADAQAEANRMLKEAEAAREKVRLLGIKAAADLDRQRADAAKAQADADALKDKYSAALTEALQAEADAVASKRVYDTAVKVMNERADTLAKAVASLKVDPAAP